MHFKNVKFICLFVFLIQLFISHFFLPLIKKSDLFPFYDWNLFSYINSHTQFNFILIHEINDQKLTRPLFLFNERHQFQGKMSKFVPAQINRLALATLENDKTHINIYKNELENNLFFRHSHIKYELAQSNIDIKTTLKSRSIEKFISLGFFEYQQTK